VYKLAALDQLTGLYNRRSGEQRLAQEISRAQRHGRPLTVLLLDLNELKAINDRHGHAAGDLVIKDSRSACSAPFEDQISRCASAEMNSWLCCQNAVRMKCVTCLAAWKASSWNIREKKSTAISSSGFTDYKPGESPAELLKRADDALYAHKRSEKRIASRRFRPQFRNRCLDQEHRQLASTVPLVTRFFSHDNPMFLTGTLLKKYFLRRLGVLVCYARCQDCHYAEREAQSKYW